MAVGIRSGNDRITRSAGLPATWTFSMSMWFKWTAFFGTAETWFALARTSGAVRDIYARQAGSSTTFFLDSTATDTGTFTIAEGTWYWIGVTSIDNGALKLFYAALGDAAISQVSNGVAPAGSAPQTIWIGNNPNSTGDWPEGDFAYVKVWNATLSDDEIKQERWCALPKISANLIAFIPAHRNNSNEHLTDYSPSRTNFIAGGSTPVNAEPPGVAWSTGKRRIFIPAAGSTPVEQSVTESWENLQITSSEKPESHENLQAAVVENLESHENLQSASQETIESYESLVGAELSGIESWENLEAATMEGAESHENLQSVSSETVESHENLIAASLDQVEAWESLQAAAAEQIESWENRGPELVEASVTESWENLQGISADLNESWESLSSAAREQVEAWESLLAVFTEQIESHENLQFASFEVTESWENRGLVFDPVFYSVLIINQWQDEESAWLASQVDQVEEQSVEVLESAETAVEQSITESYESLSGIVANRLESWENLSPATKEQIESWESIVSLFRDQAESHENLLGVLKEQTESWENKQNPVPFLVGVKDGWVSESPDTWVSESPGTWVVE